MTDPLAELQARRAQHDEWHASFSRACDLERCSVGRWLALCDRLAVEAQRFERAYRNNLLGLAELDAQRDKASAALAKYGQHHWLCGFASAANMGGEDPVCTCGYLAALTAQPATEEGVER